MMEIKDLGREHAQDNNDRLKEIKSLSENKENSSLVSILSIKVIE